MEHTIEATALIALLALLFCGNYLSNKKSEEISNRGFYMTPAVTTALKGLMAIVIICHHYCLYNWSFVEHTRFMSIIPLNGGNFSLAIFLFLSGYGVTKSEMAQPKNPVQFMKRRIWKILKPCLIVYAITLIVYSLMTQTAVTGEQVAEFHLNPFLPEITKHDFSIGLILNWFFVKMDWYVYTTLVMYVLFYISFRIFKGNDQDSYNKRLLGFVTLTCGYYVLCCILYTHNEAHYYRNLWAFVIGSLLACKPTLLTKLEGAILFLCIIAFNYYREGSLYAGATFIAILLLIVVGYTNYKFEISSKILLYIGGISYYIYLCHRMFYNFLWSQGMLSFPIFVALSIAFAAMIHKLKKLSVVHNKV